MFEWMAGKKEPQRAPYVNPFKVGDRVETSWTFYNSGMAGDAVIHRSYEKHWNEDPQKPTWDVFDIIIDEGKHGIVTGTIRDSVVVELDGFPFKVVLREEGLRKLEA